MFRCDHCDTHTSHSTFEAMLSRTRRWQRPLHPTEWRGPILTWLFLSFRFGPSVHPLGPRLPLVGTVTSLPGTQDPQSGV